MRYPIAICFCLLSALGLAQQDTIPVLRSDLSTFYNDSLSHNFGYNAIQFTALREQDEREAIGAVYVMDRRMILASGARDIQELLMYIPSISFGTDVNDVVGLAMRGLWVHEGKFIIMINGMPINELSFGSYCFIKRLALDNVSQVEIILGPGSVNYGGTAALGVINVVTLKAGQRDGTTVTANVSATKSGVDRQNIGLTGNHYLGNSTFFSYAFSGIKGHRADGLDNEGRSWRDSTRLNSDEFYMSIERKNLKAQVYQNDYYYSVFGDQFDVQMKTSNADITYTQKAGSRNLVSAQIGYIRQLPWNIQNSVDYNLINSNTLTERIHSSTQLNTKIGRYFESNVGFQMYKTTSQRLSIYADLTSENARRVSKGLNGIGLFMELFGRFKFGNIHSSCRFEVSNLVRPMLAPRFGYSLIRKNWNFKLSYAESFKLPTIENFYLGPSGETLLPESNSTWDVEWGMRLNKKLNWRINAFKNRIENPIVYVFDDLTYDNYLNRSSISNLGAESMLTFLDNSWTIRGAFSIQQLDAQGTNLPEVITPRAESVQGLSNFQGNFVAFYQVNKAFSISTTATFKSAAFNYEYVDDSEELAPVEYDALWKFNVFANYTPLRWSDFELRVGILNILDAKDYYLSPYAVGNYTMPASPRELMLILNYRITN
ncbi:MAG: hypothetical protein RLZZ262_36 [Bacteroidota bacterium]